MAPCASHGSTAPTATAAHILSGRGRAGQDIALRWALALGVGALVCWLVRCLRLGRRAPRYPASSGWRARSGATSRAGLECRAAGARRRHRRYGADRQAGGRLSCLRDRQGSGCALYQTLKSIRTALVIGP